MAERDSKLAKSIETESRKQAPITIKAPNIQILTLAIAGESPYVQHKFSQKAKEMIMATQRAGSTAKKGAKREPKDFAEVCRQATHFSREGWIGLPAPAFRAAMISACRTVGFKMVLAKLAVFIKADGFDADDGMPLVRIYGNWRQHDMAARNDNGSADIRSRPMWDAWVAKVSIRYDADIFAASDIVNLMNRVGAQVGIGEGRNDSKDSAGMGWGEFSIIDEATFNRFVEGLSK